MGFLDVFKRELSSIIPIELLSKTEKLTDTVFSNLFFEAWYLYNNKVKKFLDNPDFYLTRDMLDNWRKKLENNLGIALKASPEKAINFISTYLNLNKDKIFDTREQWMTHRRSAKSRHPNLDENYFKKIDSLEKAFFLGFFFSDGTIGSSQGVRKTIVLELGANKPHYRTSDFRLLIQWCNALGLDPKKIGPKYYTAKRENLKALYIQFSSETLAKSLYDLGYVI